MSCLYVYLAIKLSYLISRLAFACSELLITETQNLKYLHNDIITRSNNKSSPDKSWQSVPVTSQLIMFSAAEFMNILVSELIGLLCPGYLEGLIQPVCVSGGFVGLIQALCRRGITHDNITKRTET